MGVVKGYVLNISKRPGEVVLEGKMESRHSKLQHIVKFYNDRFEFICDEKMPLSKNRQEDIVFSYRFKSVEFVTSFIPFTKDNFFITVVVIITISS